MNGIECPFCGEMLVAENVGAAMLETKSKVVRCHKCGTELEVALEIKEG